MKGRVDWNREDVKVDLRRCLTVEGLFIQQDLAEKYGVSRNTINAQIRKLNYIWGLNPGVTPTYCLNGYRK